MNEAGYATGFVEWSVTGTGYGVTSWADITRDSAGNLYHTQHYNGYPTVIKRNSVGVEQCSSSITGVSISSGSMDVDALEIDSENNLYLIGETSNGINGETALGGTDVVVVKFSSECSGSTLPTIWTKHIGTSDTDRAVTAEFRNDALYMLATTRGDWGATHSGTQYVSGGFKYEPVHLKMDTDGNILSIFQSSETMVVDRTDDAYSLRNILVDSNGDYYVSGSVRFDDGYTDADQEFLDGIECLPTNHVSFRDSKCNFIRKYNSSHVLQWTELYQTDRYQDIFQSIQLNSDETEIITVGTSSLDFNSVSLPANVGYPDVLVNSISPTDGSINWTKFTGYAAGELAGRKGLTNAAPVYGEDALGLDESDNIYIAQSRYFQGQPNGGNHSRQFNQITKLDSTGNEIWSRVFGGSEHNGSGNVPNEYLYSTHVTKGGQLYLTGTSYGQDSFNAGGAKLYKIDGSIDNYTSPMLDAEAGFDYFKVDLIGPTPTSTVTFNLASDNTSQMITTNDSFDTTTSGYVYVAAIQDNVSDGDTVVNVNISTSSTDSDWNGLNFTVPVTVIDQSQHSIQIHTSPLVLTMVQLQKGILVVKLGLYEQHWTQWLPRM